MVSEETAVVRTQIQFTESELARLRQMAAERHVSVSAIVREAVDARLARGEHGASLEQRKRRAQAAAGRFHSGLGDLAARQDDYFAESLDE
jgi:hypothetical protein